MKITHTMQVGELSFISSDIYILSASIESQETHFMSRGVISNSFYCEML